MAYPGVWERNETRPDGTPWWLLPPGGYEAEIDAVEEGRTASGVNYLDVSYSVFLDDMALVGEEPGPGVVPSLACYEGSGPFLRPERIYLGPDFTSERGWGRYRALVAACEDTDPDFKYTNVDGGEQQLVGRGLGIVCVRASFMKRDGTRGWANRIVGFTSVDRALAGDFDRSLLSQDALTETFLEPVVRPASSDGKRFAQ